MNSRTAATIGQLRHAAWFSKIGKNDTNSAIVLKSWPEAMASCASAQWENLCLEAANAYRERLVEKSASILERWNPAVDELKPVIEPFVREKTKHVTEDNKLPVVFENTVQWDILHLCLEAEFSEIVQPGFYASQAYWYMQGHFPCGWSGAFPQGKLIVF